MPRTRKSGDGGLYLDAKRGLWIGVVDVGYTPEGKRKQARVTSKSQSVARAKLTKLMSEINAHGSPLSNMTVAEWGASWLSGIESHKPQTFRTYQSILKTWVLPHIGRKNVKDVRPSDLRFIYDTMKAAGKSSSTALKAHNVMSSMFESARLERLVANNVANDLRPPKAAKSTRDTLSPEETARILVAAQSIPHGSKWWVSLYAGIRQGERLGATIDSIDFDRSLFTVQWNLVEGNFRHGCGGTCKPGKSGKPLAPGYCPDRKLIVPEGMDVRLLQGRYMLVPPKSGEPRTIPLTDKLRHMLEAHADELQSQPNPHGLLWPALDGSPTSARDDQEQWAALLAAAKVKRAGVTTHWARHTAISDMSAAGVSDRVIGEQVGHKSPGVTGRYQHVSSTDALAAQQKLGERRQLGN